MENINKALIETALTCDNHRQEEEKRLTEEFSEQLAGMLVTPAGWDPDNKRLNKVVVDRVIHLSVHRGQCSAYCHTRRVKKDGKLGTRRHMESILPNATIEMPPEGLVK